MRLAGNNVGDIKIGRDSSKKFTSTDINTGIDILHMLKNRDETALGIIKARYGRLILSVARHILGNETDVQECENDVLLDVWNSVPPASPESISAYACMLARRRAIDMLRHRMAKKRGGGEYESALEELSECAEVMSGMPDTDTGTSELSRVIDEFLSSLTYDDRRVFMARYYGFERPADIAARLSITKNAVNIKLSRLRARLKKHLEESGINI